MPRVARKAVVGHGGEVFTARCSIDGGRSLQPSSGSGEARRESNRICITAHSR